MSVYIMGCSEKVSFQLFPKFSWVGHGAQIFRQSVPCRCCSCIWERTFSELCAQPWLPQDCLPAPGRGVDFRCQSVFKLTCFLRSWVRMQRCLSATYSAWILTFLKTKITDVNRCPGGHGTDPAIRQLLSAP